VTLRKEGQRVYYRLSGTMWCCCSTVCATWRTGIWRVAHHQQLVLLPGRRWNRPRRNR
jgi:hypothetical protein